MRKRLKRHNKVMRHFDAPTASLRHSVIVSQQKYWHKLHFSTQSFVKSASYCHTYCVMLTHHVALTDKKGGAPWHIT